MSLQVVSGKRVRNRTCELAYLVRLVTFQKMA